MCTVFRIFLRWTKILRCFTHEIYTVESETVGIVQSPAHQVLTQTWWTESVMTSTGPSGSCPLSVV